MAPGPEALHIPPRVLPPGCSREAIPVVMPSGSQIPPFCLLFLLGDVAFSVCLEHLPVHPEAHSPRRLRGLCLTDHFLPLSIRPPGSDLFVVRFPPVETLLVAGTGCAQITCEVPASYPSVPTLSWRGGGPALPGWEGGGGWCPAGLPAPRKGAPHSHRVG